MFRLLAKLFFFLIVVVIIVGIFFWGHRSYYLSRYLTKMFRTPIKIENLHFQGKDLSLEKVHIFNPKEDKLEKAFYSPLIRITTQPKKFFSQNMIIEEVAISEPYIGIELYSANGEQSNWSTLVNRLQVNGKSSSQTTYQIKRLLMTNVTIEVVNAVTGETITPEPIPKIELIDISQDTPMTSKELMAAIMEKIVQEVAKQRGIQGIIQNLSPIPPAKKLILPLLPQ